MRTGVVVVTIALALAAAILLSVSLLVAKDTRRDGVPHSGAARQGDPFREARGTENGAHLMQ